MLEMGFEKIEDIGFLRLRGSVDGETFEMFHASANGLLDQGVSRIVLDLSDVDYIVSSGFRTIGSCVSGAKDMGGGVVIMSPTDGVREILELLGFHNLLRIVATKEEAIRFFYPDGLESGKDGDG